MSSKSVLPPLFHRHDLLLLDPAAELFNCGGEASLIRDHLAAGLPVVVRRPGTDRDGVHCGIALPPAMGKRKLGFFVRREAVRALAPRPTLSALPPERRAGLDALLPFDPEVFGSHAWELLTGRACRHAGSDLDLIIRPKARGAELAALLEALRPLTPPGCDLEIILGDGRAFSFREYCDANSDILIKTDHDVALMPKRHLAAGPADPERIAAAALRALGEELETYPKPGLVSLIDAGSHADMESRHFTAAIAALGGFFAAAARAGGASASFAELQMLGLEAEQTMLQATGGVNTHRGAIFVLGLLAAAAGYRAGHGGGAPGELVRILWGEAIRDAVNPGSHGDRMRRQHGAGGARAEAAAGFPTVRTCGLPALRQPLSRNAARVHSFFAMLETADDTTLLYRGGAAGRDFARTAARDFNLRGGATAPDWAARAEAAHRDFSKRGLSAGGVADLLAAALFLDELENWTWPE